MLSSGFFLSNRAIGQTSYRSPDGTWTPTTPEEMQVRCRPLPTFQLIYEPEQNIY